MAHPTGRSRLAGHKRADIGGSGSASRPHGGSMKHFSRTGAFTLTLIADTSDRFSDFSPYVASINNAGMVAFQAALRSGGTGVFTGSGGAITMVADTAGGLVSNFYSHPAINCNGALSVYADLNSGGQGVFLSRDGQLSTLADTSGPFKGIGPLGPTMNDEGTVRQQSGSGLRTRDRSSCVRTR